MKTEKLKLNEISGSELNELEMCRVLGGGTPGCCQCGCKYAGTPGGATSSANSSANNAKGLVTDGNAQPCCDSGGNTTIIKEFDTGRQIPQDNLCFPRPIIP